MNNLSWGELAIIGVVGAVAFLIVLGAIQNSRKPTFELKKEDWACTVSHQESTTTYVQMGGGNNTVLMPITTWHTVCDQWARK